MKLIETYNQILQEQLTLVEAIKQINNHELIVESGTELYHGTIEPFDIKNISVGGYDKILWTSISPMIAQTYIPTSSSSYHISTDSVVRPSLDPSIIKIQKLVGINYEQSSFESQDNRIISYMPASIFKTINDKENELYNQYAAANKKFEQIKPILTNNELLDTLTDEQFDEYDKIESEMLRLQDIYYNYKSETEKRKLVNNKLEHLGYKPTKIESDQNHSWTLNYNDGTILKPNERSQGRLFIIKPQRDLKIYDNTDGGNTEGDLTDVEYHNLDLFRQVEKEGYDGIKINDFAQSDDYGNVGHISIGLFKHTIRDLKIQEISAQHQDIRKHGWNDSPEYLNFKGKGL